MTFSDEDRHKFETRKSEAIENVANQLDKINQKLNILLLLGVAAVVLALIVALTK